MAMAWGAWSKVSLFYLFIFNFAYRTINLIKSKLTVSSCLYNVLQPFLVADGDYV